MVYEVTNAETAKGDFVESWNMWMDANVCLKTKKTLLDAVTQLQTKITKNNYYCFFPEMTSTLTEYASNQTEDISKLVVGKTT